ncbi:RNA 2',3'-cyclic phosphodiesterase [bacterium]|nr:RNA 2',3'-cyclic phosphodiesterase [bacterium]
MKLRQETIRTFIAIEIPDEIQAKLVEIQTELAKFMLRVSWVKQSNIHLTLKFLGDIQANQVESINSVLQSVAESHSPFDMSLAEIGVFPNLRRPRVIWIGITKGAEQATQLAKAVSNSLQPLGFQREKRGFTPHLTLGRIRRPVNLQNVSSKFNQYDNLDIPTLKIDQIAFIQSQLHPRGSIYTPLRKFALK